MEKVISRRNLKKNTFSISKGDKLSLEFLEESSRDIILKEQILFMNQASMQ